MRWALSQDYEVFLAEDRKTAMEVFRAEQPRVVTLDLGLPPSPTDASEGFQALMEILEEDPLAKVIVITGQGEKSNALEAVGKGAYDFFCKPIQIDEFRVVLGRARYVSQLERERLMLQAQTGDVSFEGMLGTSPQIQKVFAEIGKVATSDVPILILGESGTGKEMVAQAIHRRSSRKDGPFVVINCSAIPETLLESELFGHEKGAFTGAHMRRGGRFEKAQGGTLFLDEIGEISLALQVKLLRFLQEQKIERVGGREEISIDTRILAATNKNLKTAIKEGKFREDLFYRLGVVSISLPPLREREGDILFLAKCFLEKYSRENNKKGLSFTPQAIQALESHSWEGNIRELENRVKRAVVMTEKKQISPPDLEISQGHRGYPGKTLKDVRENIEKDLIQKSLARNKGNISKVAEELGISRPTLYEMMDKLKISK
jgi:two-component system NtrC family response regulator